MTARATAARRRAHRRTQHERRHEVRHRFRRHKSTTASRIGGAGWLLALIPLLLLGLILTLRRAHGRRVVELAGPPVEQVAIQRITLPEPGVIDVEVVNDGPMEVTIPQVLVDDAYWSFTAEPSNTLRRFDRATFTIPYPWVEEETHVVRLITGLGATFELKSALPSSPRSRTSSLFVRFGLIGIYVGIVPVLLGMLWYPFLRRLSWQAMNFVLSLTVGLLLYLAVGTWLDALEFAAELPAFWQGVPLVTLIALLTLGVLMVVGSAGAGAERSPLEVSYLIALGIGLHNLGEGLAIGAAFGLGEAALGTFLILGFTLHNITEGIGIVAPLCARGRRLTSLRFLCCWPAGRRCWACGSADSLSTRCWRPSSWLSASAPSCRWCGKWASSSCATTLGTTGLP